MSSIIYDVVNQLIAWVVALCPVSCSMITYLNGIHWSCLVSTTFYDVINQLTT
jgi:hypothetical protein